jgi:hypothetical protein
MPDKAELLRRCGSLLRTSGQNRFLETTETAKNTGRQVLQVIESDEQPPSDNGIHIS